MRESDSNWNLLLLPPVWLWKSLVFQILRLLPHLLVLSRRSLCDEGDPAWASSFPSAPSQTSLLTYIPFTSIANVFSTSIESESHRSRIECMRSFLFSLHVLTKNSYNFCPSACQILLMKSCEYQQVPASLAYPPGLESTSCRHLGILMWFRANFGLAHGTPCMNHGVLCRFSYWRGWMHEACVAMAGSVENALCFYGKYLG